MFVEQGSTQDCHQPAEPNYWDQLSYMFIHIHHPSLRVDTTRSKNVSLVGDAKYFVSETIMTFRCSEQNANIRLRQVLGERQHH